METKQVKVINIQWEAMTFDYKEIIKLNREVDYGLYQIYGHHPAYGDNALLYIGIAKDNTFAQRLHNRGEFMESTARPKIISLGWICEDNDLTKSLKIEHKEWKKLISDCERLLLKTHTPAFNSQISKSLRKDIDYELLIINWGDYMRLLPEVSTLRMSYDYWNYERPLR